MKCPFRTQIRFFKRVTQSPTLGTTIEIPTTKAEATTTTAEWLDCIGNECYAFDDESGYLCSCRRIRLYGVNSGGRTHND
ncbi:hypothetical protein FACS18949_11960 [Clostridia bacterium]|nr:hypothetical protein FACS18949_11960 [Clostridia bacterium]